MALPIEKTLGFLADLIAQHVFLAGVPKTMRRRWNLSANFNVADDAANERLDVDIGATPEDDGDAALTVEYDASAVTGDAIGVDINETAPPTGQSIGMRWRQAATTVLEIIADASSYLELNTPTQMALQIADVVHAKITAGLFTLPTGVALEIGDNAADDGTIRLESLAAILWRKEAGGGNVSGLWKDATDNLTYGGVALGAIRPPAIYLDATGAVFLSITGTPKVEVRPATVEFNVPISFGDASDVATEGDARFEEDGAGIWRDAAGTGNIAGYWMTGSSDIFNIGGLYGTAARPTVIAIDPANELYLKAGGNDVAIITAATVQMDVPVKFGATGIASQGVARFAKDFVQSYRNITNDGNHTAIASDAADNNLWVGGVLGGSRPNGLMLDGTSFIYSRIAGTNRVIVTSAEILLAVPLIDIDEDQVSPKLRQASDDTASVTCDSLTVESQGASNATGGASKGTSGPLLNTGGKGTVHADNLDGNLAYHALPSGGWYTAEMTEFWEDSVTIPTTKPATGVHAFRSSGDWIMWASGGSKRWLTSGGTCAASDEYYTHKETTGGGGGPTTVEMVTLDDDTGADVLLVVTARAPTSGDTASYRVAATFENTGGTLALVGGSTTPIHSAEQDASWDADLVVSNDNISVQLAHDATETIDYFIKLEVWTNR
jgi:hypothetical protein